MLLKGEMGCGLRAWMLAVAVALAGTAAIACTASAGEVRHYEQVSPADKGDGDIVGEGLAIVASKSGDGATFESRMPFGDTIGSGVVGRTAYLARRSASGEWLTHAITPMSRPESVQIFFGNTKAQVFSDDLSAALVWGYDLPASTDDTPDRDNVYLEDTATRALQPITVSQVEAFDPFAFFTEHIWGVSADARHVGLSVSTQMLPEATPGVENAYKWDDGTLTLAGVLPDGTVPAGGSYIDPHDTRGTMSPDGTRLVFNSPADFSTPPQLYMHIDGRRSVWISQPEGSDRSDPTGIAFQGMTPDGKNVFFVSDSPLLDSDTAPGPDLYRWTESADPANDANLTLITNTGSASNDPGGYGEVLVGMSDDGSKVYIQDSSAQLKVWDDGVTRVIDPSISRVGDPTQHLTLLASAPGLGRVSPDGEWLAYLKDSQMYLYGLRDDVVTCVSCPSTASLVPRVTNSGRLDYLAFRPRFLSANGKVFFTTTGALVPEDTNGVADVYAYDGPSRTLELLTSGKGSDPMEFADASASGNDVFIVTRQRLAPSDSDDYVDLYDVRVGPAPPNQPATTAPACEGDACQGPLSGAPADDQLGSLLLDESAKRGSRRAGLTLRHRFVFHGAVGVLRVRLGAPGAIKWSGRGLVSGSVRRSRPGTATLRVRLGHRARAQLKRTGRYSTTVRLSFRAVDGTTARATIRVTFRAVAKKGR